MRNSLIKIQNFEYIFKFNNNFINKNASFAHKRDIKVYKRN